MPQFNLDEYELVEDRIRRFYEDHPDGRIVSYEVTEPDDRAKGYFVVRAHIYLDHEDQHANCPKATGLAFEIEGGQGANRTAALENAETSAIGRALANADYAKGKRPSRTEMEKAARPEVTINDDEYKAFIKSVQGADTVEVLQGLWNDAVERGFSGRVMTLVNERKREINAS